MEREAEEEALLSAAQAQLAARRLSAAEELYSRFIARCGGPAGGTAPPGYVPGPGGGRRGAVGAGPAVTAALPLSPRSAGRDLATALNNRGQIKYLRVEFAAAVEDYTAAIERQPGFEVPYYNRGLVLYRLGTGQAQSVTPAAPGRRAERRSCPGPARSGLPACPGPLPPGLPGAPLCPEIHPQLEGASLRCRDGESCPAPAPAGEGRHSRNTWCGRMFQLPVCPVRAAREPCCSRWAAVSSETITVRGKNGGKDAVSV